MHGRTGVKLNALPLLGVGGGGGGHKVLKP